MEKKHYVLYLNPVRPDFAQTMTEEERAIMMRHVAYWKDYMDKGITIVYGPVSDPEGAYGIGIVEVDDEEQVKELIKNDPASAINKYEYYQMRAVLPAK